MAAYEVLLLNTAIPQIQAAQSGDTYVVPRDIAINATAIISANSATDALRITQTGAGNAILVEDSANPDSTPFVVTAAGDVGIGTNSPAYKLAVNSGASTTIGLFTSTGSAAFLGLVNSGATTYIGNDSASGSFVIQTPSSGFSTKLTLDNSGNLGLGVTPSAWNSVYRTYQVGANASVASSTGTNNIWVGSNYFFDSTGTFIRIAAGFATRYEQVSGQHVWYNAPTGAQNAAIGFTQAMTLDASGRLGIGTTSPGSFDAVADDLVIGSGSGNFGATIYSSTTGKGTILFADGLAAAGADSYRGFVEYDHSGNFLRFGTDATERARITSGGYFKASNNGTYNGAANSYHEFYNTANDEFDVWCQHASATTPKGIRVYYSAAAPNGTGNHFLYCDDTGGQRASIRSNGGLANYQSNNVDLSDARTKTDINPLASYWNKIAALEIVTYKYKDQTHDDLNIGVIAQQVEQVAPEFVDADGFGETPEDGVPLKTIYNKDLTFAAIKALQEAMARIETLEAEVAALKGA